LSTKDNEQFYSYYLTFFLKIEQDIYMGKEIALVLDDNTELQSYATSDTEEKSMTFSEFDENDRRSLVELAYSSQYLELKDILTSYLDTYSDVEINGSTLSWDAQMEDAFHDGTYYDHEENRLVLDDGTHTAHVDEYEIESLDIDATMEALKRDDGTLSISVIVDGGANFQVTADAIHEGLEAAKENGTAVHLILYHY
jgi:hypothetical protein